jgi:hypothetical protein
MLGSALASSLVDSLGSRCGLGAALAEVMVHRFDDIVDFKEVGGASAEKLFAIENFISRGWLSPIAEGWLVGPRHIPKDVPAFLQGVSASQAAMADYSLAAAAITLPRPPSFLSGSLPRTGLAYSNLLTTEGAFKRVANAAATSFVLMTPFLNDSGLDFACELFALTKAVHRTLIIRRSGRARSLVWHRQMELRKLNVKALDYTLPTHGGGYETFHAKVALADNELAYVGSANLTIFARNSVELGTLMEGRSARIISSVMGAIQDIALPVWDAKSLLESLVGGEL